jgi:hypothetical protein
MRTGSIGGALALASALYLFAAGAHADEPEFTIRIHAHQFLPAEVRVPAGVKIRIVIDNQDELPEEFDSHPLNREKHIPAKAKVTLFLGPLDPGRYPFEGETRGDPGATARGVLIVK